MSALLGPEPRSGSGLAALPPLSLYIHLPWCLRKCPYCDFNSHEFETLPEARYLEALDADLLASVPLVWGRSVQSIFLGGGTPSLFAPESIDRILASARSLLRVAADAEVTLEANPGTFERARFEGFRQAGVNRLSLGIQSFSDTALKALGRVHDRDQAIAAAETAAEVFPTFNLDLMFGLPEQDLAALEADLDLALRFGPPHLSLYQLTLEPNTFFARHPPRLPDEDRVDAMQQRIFERTAQAGLERYEVSAYAREGHRCQHNLNYWRFGDYLGIGAGAHGKLSFYDRILRQARFRHPGRYMEAALAGAAVELEQAVEPGDRSFEFMLNALRLVDGVPSPLFAERTGLSLAALARPMARALERGLIDPDPRVIRATPLGLRFLNDLQGLFL